jgi:uncharacterized membrane protein (Fun14 family)
LSVTKSIVVAVASFGGAATIGGALGWGFKKLLKVLLVLVAAFTALIAIPIGYLTYEGVISINWDKLYALLDSATYASVSWLSTLAQTVAIAVPALGGFATGFAIGFQKG